VRGDDDLVLVVNLNGELHATQGICSHQYFELDKGFLAGDSITSPCISRASLWRTASRSISRELPLAVYAVVVEGGRVLIEVPRGRSR